MNNMDMEIARLMDGACDASTAAESGMGVVEYVIRSDAPVAPVIARVRHALIVLVSAEMMVDIAYEADEIDEWEQEPMDEAMSISMQAWLDSFLTESAASDTDGLARSFGYGRDWRWLAVQKTNEHEAVVSLVITGFPVSGLEALRTLCLQCGATAFEECDEDEADASATQGE